MSVIKNLASGWTSGSPAANLRQARLDLLLTFLPPQAGLFRILDVGGQPEFWQALDLSRMPPHTITFYNLMPVPCTMSNAVSLIGDARDLSQFDNASFDLVFSNSVIEHVGGLREQRHMAKECARVAKNYFVQTPNRFFPMEPHFLIPCFQFLPVRIRAWCHSRWDLGWWKAAHSYHEALEEVESIRLMTEDELRHCFPDATIWREKWHCITKSFVAHNF